MKSAVFLGLLSVLVVLALLAAGLMLKLAADSRAMSVIVGVVDGRLTGCPMSLNCVSSDALPQDSHYIAPIADPHGSTWADLADRVAGMPGAALVEQRDDYLYFKFTSGFWRFVDDVEFHYRPEANQIAMRSASRVGRSDWNANRNRLESIRAAVE